MALKSETLAALRDLGISEKKVDEISSKPQIERNIADVFESASKFTRMHYTLACIAPKKANLERLARIIDTGLVKHDNILRGLFLFLETDPSDEEIEKFIAENDYSKEEIKKRVESKSGKPKKEILKELKLEMPYSDSKTIIDIVNDIPEPEVTAEEKPAVEKDWLDEGEVSRLLKPSENTQASDEILQAHLQRTGGKVVTRFPPEPNGSLHIGHAKALNFSFSYAAKHGGYTYLRYDDTNPNNESEDHFNSILEDVKWLGFEPKAITYSSDYFEKIYKFSEDLIRKNKGYICHCSMEDIRNRRKMFQEERDAGRFDPSILSPYRNRTTEENLQEFKKMLNSGYSEGQAVFRFKMDLESKNPLMLDLVGARIIDKTHPLKNVNYIVYPSYEFALCVADSLEDVTHSFCSREFYTRQESYHWVLRNLGLYEPVQWEFSRLNLSNTVLSKRKLTELVNGGMDWDDPRFYTIKGMRRRGFPASAINSFVKSVGITFAESVIDVKILENFVRDDLNKTAKRVFCIRNPVKLIISGMGKKSVDLPVVNGSEECGSVPVDINKFVYIDGADFSENPESDFYRLTKSQPVGLINFGVVKYVEKSGDSITVQLVEDKPLKYIQWVPNLNHKATLRLYKPLFNSFDPEAVGFKNDLSSDSLEVAVGYCDPRILGAKNLDKFQFVRQGYFCYDKDSKNDEHVFNLTLPLKNVI